MIERGKQDTTGVGLIEIYDLGAGVGPELANISTRGFVDTGSNVMIAGFIVASSTGGSSQVIVRGAGPSLGDFGIADPLADPMLDLYDANGMLIASNDSWQSDQEAEIAATGLAAFKRRRSGDPDDPRARRLHRDRERQKWRNRSWLGGSLQPALRRGSRIVGIRSPASPPPPMGATLTVSFHDQRDSAAVAKGQFDIRTRSSDAAQ